MFEVKAALFDGERMWDGAAVAVEDGAIASVRECDPAECEGGLLMPGLVDAHTHMGSMGHVRAMLQSGVTATCDVSASRALVESSEHLEIVPSAGMAMGVVVSPRAFVEEAVTNGARYIKVLLFNALSIGKPALRGIVKAAHEEGLKVAVHATELATVRQAVSAGADVLLHVPMKEAFPADLAKTIAAQGMAVAPTLVMMDTFAHSGRNGYKPEHYRNAERTVALLRDSGVSILAATDANPGNFAPAVGYGDTLHQEMRLLSKAGLPPEEVLAAATSRPAEVFGLRAGRVAPGEPATMLLAEAVLEGGVVDIKRVENVWVEGERLQ